MSAKIATWHIELRGNGALAQSGESEVAAASPADLWRELARRSGAQLVHLLGRGKSADPAGVTAAADAIVTDGLGAAIGRVRFADGALSSRFAKIEITRFVAVLPGAIVVRAEALERASREVQNGWDEFWCSDLANALRHTCLVDGIGDVLAGSSDPAPVSERLPFGRASPLPLPARNAPLILIYGKLEASMSLYFDGLPHDLRAHLRFLEPGDLYSDMGWLASASLVVVLRGFEHMLENGTLGLLDEIDVPYLWFTDDDYSALEGPDFSFYTPEALAAFTRGAAGLLVTSEALRGAAASLHRNVISWPVVHDAALVSAPGERALRAGAFGGAFRSKAFTNHVFPALRDLSIRTWASSQLAHATPDVTRLRFESSFRRFVFSWQKLGLRVLVHPEGMARNIGNKSRASLLAAAYLGAVPVVGDEPAYEGVGEAEGVVRAAAGDRAAWQAALERVTDPAAAAELRHRLEAWCRTEFDPERARAPFAELLALCLPGGPEAVAMRWQRAMQSDALQRALPRASKFGKAVRRMVRGFKRRYAGRRGAPG